MPSFTSNFEPPKMPGPKIWAGALLMALLILGGLEFGLRRAGHRPSIVDDKALWAYWREQVYENGDGRVPVVIAGTSRAKTGFAPSAVADRYPGHRFIQLAVEGCFPAATLIDLAKDDRFRGVVIVDSLPDGFTHRHRNSQKPYVDYYWSMYQGVKGNDELVSRLVSNFLQSHFVVFNPSVNLERLAKAALRKRSWPDRLYFINFSDRTTHADFSIHNSGPHLAELRKQLARPRSQNLPTPEEWMAQAMELEPYIERIQGRGGKVVLIRYVTSGVGLEIEERDFPRAQYWDRLAQATKAACIHFADVESLRGFDCPDASHLDYRDVPRFTRALCEELERRGILQAGP